MPTLLFLQNFQWAFVRMDLMNVPTKFEVRSFIRSWDNSGYLSNFGQPLDMPNFGGVPVAPDGPCCCQDDDAIRWCSCPGTTGRVSPMPWQLLVWVRRQSELMHCPGKRLIAAEGLPPSKFRLGPQSTNSNEQLSRRGRNSASRSW